MTSYFIFRSVLFYVLEHAYLFWRFRFLRKNKFLLAISLPWFICMGFFPLVFLLLPPDSQAQRLLRHIDTIWQPFAYLCLIIFIAKDVFRGAAWLGKRATGERSEPKTSAAARRSRRKLLLLLFGGLVFAYGLYEARELRVNRLKLATGKLPPGAKRLRLVFAADLHIGPFLGGEQLGRVVDLILSEKPDCILLGGDILDDAMQGTAADLAELSRLRAPLGVFAVLGNHEAFGNSDRPMAFLRKAGITTLAGETANAGPLRIIGVDDPAVSAQKGRSTHNPMPLLRKTDGKRFTILLTHRPKLRKKSIGLFDLQLSGHTHGGQVIFLAPAMRAKYKVFTGLSSHSSEQGTSHLFVTTGVGFSKLPIRLLVPPEVATIDLVRAE